MVFPNQQPHKATLDQLREAVTNSQGEDHESARLIGQIEAILDEIESKLRPHGTVTGIQAPSVSNTSSAIAAPLATPSVTVAI